ncbi:CRISPR-associated protein Cas4 [Desulfosporosinus metallidurans]|uniref:CRISPR-associated exonuclease Cas4 n=1 Tax=Desulfosporosinus metallidurans TaxID=1888891 RepID=A0A1Q8QMC7_9FIRM|nr:CRISPR-associated protein Cas4 [Desulfosporosinus metallidurans]OLN28490.1 CRISPR-associated RecB family exonuclease Cas4 [Desulfosporosinus metallidurans]
MTTKSYNDEGLLSLSGIQHFAFCERQWALIHVENQWAENVKTVEGQQLHERVDDPYFTETRHDVKVVRSTPLVSRRLGLYGIADVIEYLSTPESQSSLEIRIVEYKRGKPKSDDRDEVQLCAQAMCLEEMLGTKIERGFLFYGETRRRHVVQFNGLRERVLLLSERMHNLFEKGITPMPIKGKKCNNCSLKDLCLPSLGKNPKRAASYINNLVKEMEQAITGD